MSDNVFYFHNSSTMEPVKQVLTFTVHIFSPVFEFQALQQHVRIKEQHEHLFMTPLNVTSDSDLQHPSYLCMCRQAEVVLH